MNVKTLPLAALAITLTACIDTSGLVFDRGEGGGGDGGAGSYQAMIAGDGPLAFWRFEELNGILVDDVSGNGHTAYLDDRDGAGSATLVEGAVGNAATIAGANYFLEAHSHPMEFDMLAPYTFEAWVRVGALSFAGIARCQMMDGSNLGYATSVGSDAVFHKRNDGQTIEEISAQSLVLGESFRHVAVTFDGSEGRLYIDANPVDAGNWSLDWTLPASGAPFILADAYPGESVTVDELAVYDHALDIEVLEAHFACGSGEGCD